MGLVTIITARTSYLRNEFYSSGEYIPGFVMALMPLIVAWIWCNESLYNYLVQDMEKPLTFKIHLMIGKTVSFMLMLLFIMKIFII